MFRTYSFSRGSWKEHWSTKDQHTRTSDPKWQREDQLRRRWGLSIEQAEAILREQGGVDPRSHEPLTIYDCIDHDHETGLIRGILSSASNIELGEREALGRPYAKPNHWTEDWLGDPPACRAVGRIIAPCWQKKALNAPKD